MSQLRTLVKILLKIKNKKIQIKIKASISHRESLDL